MYSGRWFAACNAKAEMRSTKGKILAAIGRRTIGLALVIACLFSVPTGAGQDVSLPVPEGLAPFGPGERMAFRIEWSPPLYLFFLPTMDAGRAEVTLEEGVEYQSRNFNRIVFTARSSGTLARLVGMNVDDRFEFLTDPETLCTRMIVKREREGKRKRDISIVYHSDERRLDIRDLDVSVNPPVVKRDRSVENVPPCIRDVLSAAYYLRTRNLSQGATIQSVVGDNEKFQEIKSTVEKRDKIDTFRGRTDTWRIETDMSGLFRQGGHLKVWISDDAKRIPVQFEARVPFGKVTGKLVEYTDPGKKRSAGVGRKPNPVSLRQ
jgi:hypothetical protein